MSSENDNLYQFGAFRFDGATGGLWENGRLIALSPKASELLLCLLESGGEFVSKREIFDYVWADTFVEDGVLTQNIYTLRKILGANEDGSPMIENKTRLGYRITVPVEKIENLNGDKFNGRESSPAATALAEITGEKTDDSQSAQTPAMKAAKNPSQIGVIFAGALLLFGGTIVFFGYRFLQTETVARSRIELENIRFQKVTDTGDIYFPTLSPDANLAAYTRADGVYVKDLNLSAESKLQVSNVKRFGFLQFSKDSNFLYLRNRASFFIPSQILKVSRYGGAAETIAENVWSAFSLSPDEKQIAFARRFPNENRQSLIVKNLESGAENELLTLALPQQFNVRAFPAWSPDGTKILAVVRGQNDEFLKLTATETQSGETEEFFAGNFQDVEQVAWLPKRNSLVVSGRTGKNLQLWEIDGASKRVRRVTNDLNEYLSLRISADGTKIITAQRNYFSNLWVIDEENPNNQKQLTFGTSNHSGYFGIDYFSNGEIIYASNEGESSDINLWRVNPNDDSNARRQLTVNAGSQNKNPRVSPDDRYIYFSSNRGGHTHIWRVEASGANPAQITFSENSAEFFPNISPDGEWLYFVRKERQSSAVWRKSLTSNQEERITEEKQFAPANFLALSPDGKHLAFQNLTEIDSENVKQEYQIAVLETANPQTVKFFSVGGFKVEVYWTNDSAAFEYIYPGRNTDRIRRISLDENVAERFVREFPKEDVFTIARSKDGRTMAVSRGRRQFDAVLLTNFE